MNTQSVDHSIPKTPPSFWPWLIGLLDGEGSFTISETPSFHCNASITLRADDWLTLKYVRDSCGLGVLRLIPAPRDKGNTNPVARWTISTIDECLEFIRYIDAAGGLVAKKRRDYEIWKLGVCLLHEHGGGVFSAGRETLKRIKADLIAVRIYREEMHKEFSDHTGRRDDGNVSTSKTGRSSSSFWASNSPEAQRARQWRQLRYAKLDQSQIDDIVTRINAGNETRTAIAAEYGVSVGLLSKFMTGNYLKRDGALTEPEKEIRAKPTDPAFWSSVAGQMAKKRSAASRSKISQESIDELIEKYNAGQTMNSLAAEYGVSRPLVSRFIRGNYVRRD